MVCTMPSWHRGRCMSRDMTSQPMLEFHDIVAGPESGLAWSLALDRVKCAIKLLWKISIISIVSLRHFRIEIKPSVSGLCWDTKTLLGVAKITSKPSALVLTTFQLHLNCRKWTSSSFQTS
jgi:hypothetical protein